MKNSVVVTIVVLLLAAGVFFGKDAFQNQNLPISQTSTASSPTSTPQIKEVDIKASFQIVTNGIVRNFKNTKYHLQSKEVFISPDDPTAVHVKSIEITWDDFFKTLPMKLTKDCLTTGDGETFCTGSAGTLRFYLNDKEDSDLLDREIKNGDKALVKF